MFHYRQRVCAATAVWLQKANGEVGQDDDLLLDAPDATPTEIQMAAGEDTEMTVDEEGRPRFAPAKNIVWTPAKPTFLSPYGDMITNC